MFTVLLVVQVLMGLGIIGLVLLQQGKGADMGAAFGAGASGTVFGAAGGGSFFTRATAVLAALFFINSILLSSPLVRDVQDPTASVLESAAPAVQESDLPASEETVDVQTVDLPPADLPEVPAQPEQAETAPAAGETAPAAETAQPQ